LRSRADAGRPKCRVARALAALALGLALTPALTPAFALALTQSQAQPSAAPSAAVAPGSESAFGTTPTDVASAVASVRSDPNLGGPHTERSLRLKSDDKKRKAEPPAPWLLEMVRWMSEAGRGLMWLLGAIAVALLIVFAWRWMRVRADAAAGRTSVLPPSHVNDLDIRPDSLPDDIAGSARALWQRGEQRAALSLLYRGALSRLVHDHAVAIRGASTEGECVVLARTVLPAAGAAFFECLVGAWQAAVYAARWPDAPNVALLFEGFDTHFAARRLEPVGKPIGAAA